LESRQTAGKELKEEKQRRGRCPLKGERITLGWGRQAVEKSFKKNRRREFNLKSND